MERLGCRSGRHRTIDLARSRDLADATGDGGTIAPGVSGFDTNAFTLNTSAFQNPFSGAWSITGNGTALSLNYAASAIPEPSTYAALFGACALALAAWKRRRIVAQSV